MSALLAMCLVGGVVFSKLPTDHNPTLRQAIVAAGETPGAHLSNLDTQITGWSYGCDGPNYAVAYFVANASPAGGDRLWLARFDNSRKSWIEASSTPPTLAEKASSAADVIAVFYDGYFLYVQLQQGSGDPFTLQYATDLTYKREFFGKTWAGLADGALFYEPNADALPGDPLAAIFDPDTGRSRAVFPPVTPTATITRGETIAGQQFAACGAQWFVDHGVPIDAKHPFRVLAGARSDVATDSLAFSVIYGGGSLKCAQAGDDTIGAVYVVLHPDDVKRMKLVEQPLADVRQIDELDLGSYLSKQSIAKLFGST